MFSGTTKLMPPKVSVSSFPSLRSMPSEDPPSSSSTLQQMDPRCRQPLRKQGRGRPRTRNIDSSAHLLNGEAKFAEHHEKSSQAALSLTAGPVQAPSGVSSSDSSTQPAVAATPLLCPLTCLAMCFGWHMVEYGVSSQSGAQFLLQHIHRPSLRVTIAQLPSSPVCAEATPPSLLVNGLLMSLLDCISFLNTQTLAVADAVPHPSLTGLLPTLEQSMDVPLATPSGQEAVAMQMPSLLPLKVKSEEMPETETARQNEDGAPGQEGELSRSASEESTVADAAAPPPTPLLLSSSRGRGGRLPCSKPPGVAVTAPSPHLLQSPQRGRRGGALNQSFVFPILQRDLRDRPPALSFQQGFHGLDGHVLETGRDLLAHTRAMNRSFSTFAAPPAASLQGSSAVKDVKDQFRHVVAVKRTSSPPLRDAASDVLQSRWRLRSKMLMQMTDALDVTVASGRLCGDVLEAGVQALQFTEEEQRHYTGDFQDGQSGTSEKEPWLVSVVPAPQFASGAQTPSSLCARAGKSFPFHPPHPYLPVSGVALLEAQHRIAITNENVSANREDHWPSCGAEQESVQDGDGGRYRTLAGGIPVMPRLTINRTYHVRGSYVAPSPCSEASGDVGARKVARLEVNAMEDLRFQIHRRYLSADLKPSVFATAMEPHDTTSAVPAVGKAKGDAVKRRRSAQEDSKDDPDDDRDACEDAAEVTQLHLTADSARQKEPNLGVVIEGILCSNTLIPRIPMPDVESRYGP